MCFLTFYPLSLQRSTGVYGVFSGSRAAKPAEKSSGRSCQCLKTRKMGEFPVTMPISK